MSAKTKYLQIRVSPEEKERLRALAERAGLDLSSYVLARALPDLQASLDRIVETLAVPGEFSHPLAEWNDRLTAAGGRRERSGIVEKAEGAVLAPGQRSEEPRDQLELTRTVRASAHAPPPTRRRAGCGRDGPPRR